MTIKPLSNTQGGVKKPLQQPALAISPVSVTYHHNKPGQCQINSLTHGSPSVVNALITCNNFTPGDHQPRETRKSNAYQTWNNLYIDDQQPWGNRYHWDICQSNLVFLYSIVYCGFLYLFICPPIFYQKHLYQQILVIIPSCYNLFYSSVNP